MSQILIRLPRHVHDVLKDEAQERRCSLQGLCLDTLTGAVQHRLARPPVAEAACEPPVTDQLAGQSQ